MRLLNVPLYEIRILIRADKNSAVAVYSKAASHKIQKTVNKTSEPYAKKNVEDNKRGKETARVEDVPSQVEVSVKDYEGNDICRNDVPRNRLLANESAFRVQIAKSVQRAECDRQITDYPGCAHDIKQLIGVSIDPGRADAKPLIERVEERSSNVAVESKQQNRIVCSDYGGKVRQKMEQPKMRYPAFCEHVCNITGRLISNKRLLNAGYIARWASVGRSNRA
jgi:hypothetical protein